MLKTFATAVCLFLTLAAAGQKQNKKSVVLLDGSRISGTIVADSSDYFDVKISTPQVIRLRKSQVSALEEITYPVKESKKSEGFFIQFSTSVLVGKNETNNTSNASFHLSSGYTFRNGIGIGIGTGLEELGVSIVPLYADIRYYPLRTKVSPFMWVKSGYGFATSDPASTYDYYGSLGGKSEGGFMFNAGAGIAMFTWQRTAINIGVGYRYQKITISNDQWWWSGPAVRETVTHYNRMELQFGFIFR